MPEGFIPGYQRVVNDIVDQIRTGQLQPGERLPTKRELGAHYHVSGQTIDTAMITLRREGWVRGHQGRGTFVTDDPPVGN